MIRKVDTVKTIFRTLLVTWDKPANRVPLDKNCTIVNKKSRESKNIRNKAKASQNLCDSNYPPNA